MTDITLTYDRTISKQAFTKSITTFSIEQVTYIFNNILIFIHQGLLLKFHRVQAALDLPR